MILVTGGTGLLGGHLLYELMKDGKKVRALYRSKKRIDNTREIFSYYNPSDVDLVDEIEWVAGDVTDVHQLDLAMDGIDEVYHCAGVVSFNQKYRDQILKTNVEGTANMVNLALERAIPKFCHVSSIASFGRPENKTAPVTESIQREENERSSIYSQSKYMAELEVWRGIEEGLNAVIINPSTIIGSGNWSAGSSALFPRVYKGLSYYTEGINGFVDVRDVVKVMQSLMEQNLFKDQFILVSEHLSFKELLSSISDSLNLNRPKIKANKLISEIAWRLETVRCALTNTEPVITKESARIALDQQFYSNDKIKETLNLEFIPIKQSVRDVSRDFMSLPFGQR